MKKTLILLIILLNINLYGQSLKGIITDTQGKPIKYATIYVHEIQTGTITSENGEFILPLSAGTYTFVIQHLNYQTVTETVEVPKTLSLEVKMTQKTTLLREVRVSAKDEDKAYRIIRNTVAKSPYYQKQLLNYTAHFYAKGNLKVKEIPKLAGKILEKETKIKKGDVYTMESVSEVKASPEKLEQKVLSKRSSLPEIFDIGDMGFGFYQIYRNSNGASVISPVTREGLSVYRYQLEYSYRDNDLLIHHIKVIPKNNNPLTFSGYIDIIDGTWHVYNLDFKVNIDYGVFKIRLQVKENFVPLEKNVWMPGSLHIIYDVKGMGFNFISNLTHSIQYKDIIVNPILQTLNPAAEVLTPVIEKKPVVSKKSEKITQDINKITEKEEFTTRDVIKLVELVEAKNKEDLKNNPVQNDSIHPLELPRRFFLTVDSNATKYDPILWEKYRTIPLSEEELTVFEQKRIQDSIEEKEKTEKLKLKKEWNFFKKKNLSVGINWQKSTLAFNTVEGFKIGVGVYLDKTFKDSATNLNNEVEIGYAFSAKKMFLTASSQWNYNPRRFASFEIFGGKHTCDFNPEPLFGKYINNSLSSLFFRDNLIHYYDKTFGGLKHKIEVFNGFQTLVGVSYEINHPLENRSDYSFFFKKTRLYKPNIPDNEYLIIDPNYLSHQQAFLTEISLSYTPRMFYRYTKDKKTKYYVRSKFPTFTLSWKKGIKNLIQSNSNFDFLELNITQNIDLKMFKSLQYQLSAGVFTNTKNIHFSQFKHFQSNNFFLAFHPNFGVFHTLPHYQFSTNEWFVLGHLKYETLYLVLKYIPGLNKTLMTENLYLSFLSNPLTKNYLEVGYSLSNIFFIGNIGVFVGFNEFKYAGWNVKVGFTLF